MKVELPPDGTEFKVELPAGTYYCGDPCYALREGLRTQLHNLRWTPCPPDPLHTQLGNPPPCWNANAIIDTEYGRIVIWGTGGDGLFSGAVDQIESNFPSGCTNLAVDTGTLAFIPIALATKYDQNNPPKNYAGQCAGHIVLKADHPILIHKNGNVETSENGDGPNLSILVEEDQEDDEDWEED